jgi:phytoene dehydrogenase-like protein
MNNKKVIIIGAGIAGLSAGCYLKMNGFETQIFEAHNIPGGLCTSWKREGYLFDGCLHSFGSLKPDRRLYHWWNEVINLAELNFYFHEELCQVFLDDGQVVHFHVNPDKLMQELKTIAPEDGKFIDDFIKSIKHLARFDLQIAKPIELWSPIDYFLSQFRVAPYIRHLKKWRHTVKEMTSNCRSDVLKRVLDQDFFSYFPAYFLLISLAEQHKQNSGYPIGGSLQIALKIENQYKQLGGKIQYNATVKTINVENNRVQGVTLENGEHHHADIVISAADGYQTIFEMLGGQFVNQKIRERYKERAMWPSAILVSLGMNRTFADIPAQIDLSLRKPLIVDSESTLTSLPITIYNFDPTLADEGKTCLRVILKTSNDKYWKNLRDHDSDIYKQEKQRIANEICDILDEYLGNIKEYVDVVDVATPATFIRYTRNWRGSTQGWVWLPGLIPETMSKTLPGLKDFYMVGQWVSPGGGVSAAFVSGRDLTRIICKQERRKFVTTQSV